MSKVLQAINLHKYWKNTTFHLKNCVTVLTTSIDQFKNENKHIHKYSKLSLFTMRTETDNHDYNKI